MKHIRWYDKTPELGEVFEFIQQLSFEVQNKIAQDGLQILIKDFHLNLDDEITRINRDYNYDCKRWYDGNIDLFSSFEIIKKLPADLKNEIVKRLMESVLLVYIEEKGMAE